MSLRKSNWVDNPRSTVTRETNNFYRQILDILSTRYIPMLSGNILDILSTRYIAMLSGNADVSIFYCLRKSV